MIGSNYDYLNCKSAICLISCVLVFNKNQKPMDLLKLLP